jgi:diguanylate cyclase (GGDEF)-like protein/PAS domain S-box-containing protein
MQTDYLSVRQIPLIANYQLEQSSLAPFMTILGLVREISGIHAAAVNLVDEHSQKTIVSLNCANLLECARDDSICALAVDQGLPLIIGDCRQDMRVQDNPFVAGKERIQFYAGFPIHTATGGVVGALCMFDGHPQELSAHQQSRIADLAVLTGSLLDLHFLNAQKNRNAAFMSAQSKVLQDALQGKDLDALVADLLFAGEMFHGAVRLAVKEVDETGRHLRWLCGPSLSTAFVEVQHLMKGDLTSAPCGHAALTRTRTEVPNVSTFEMDERYRRALLDEGICSSVSVPLLAADGTLLGTWALYCSQAPSDHSVNDELINLLGPLLSNLIERTYVTRNLARSERQLNEAQEVAQIGSFSIDLETDARTYSAVTGKIFGRSPNTISGSLEEYRRIVHPDDWERLQEEIMDLVKTGKRMISRHRIIRENDGALRWVEVASDLIVNDEGKPVRRTGTVTDITELHGTEESLNLNQQAVELSNIGIVIVDASHEDLPVIYANAATEAISGYRREELIGKNCRILQGRFTGQHSLAAIRDGIREQREAHAVVRNMHRNGDEYWIDLRIQPIKNSLGEVTHFIGFQYDLTDRIRYERELIHQAGHDTLTGLVNRNLLIDRLEQVIAHSVDGKTLAALVFFDLDKFKLINDSLGHFAGDDLLKQCAIRLAAEAPAGSTIARMGGDEFVVLLEAPDDAVQAKTLTDRILRSLNLPFVLDGHSIAISSSAGIAMFPAHGSTATDLLRHADIAMYRAKSNGRANSQLFENSWSVIESQKLTLKEEIAAGIEKNQFCLHYQPKIDASSSALIGFEALVRWNHPRHGLLYPDRFIDAAEEFGLILPLGTWVLQEACRQNRRWRDAGRYYVPVAVNVSASQFRDEHFVWHVQQSLRDCALEASALELEVTESVVMESPEKFIGVLKTLHTQGVSIAVDDFGTGYSSLSFIKRFPIDVLKIDKTFVRDIGTDPSDAAICQTIIVMAHNLGLKVVAEGVETADQAFFLLEYGCDVFQGYLYSKALPPDADFSAIVANKSPYLAASVEAHN